MYAVVATGGKQHRVAAGDEVVVEKLNTPVGETVSFDVIFLADGEEIVVDADKLSASTVTAEVLEHFKGEKAVVFKFKKRKGYKRLKGHRQDLTRVRITDVTAGAAKPKRSTAKKKVEAAEEAVVDVVENEPVVAEEAPKAAKKAPARKKKVDAEAPAEVTEAPEAAESE